VQIRTNKFLDVTALILAAGMLSSMPAQAHGAIAMGKPANVSKDGLAMGTGYNYSTTEGAKLRALEECLSFAEAPLATRGLCKVVEVFNRQCYAISLDPKEGTPGVGWAIAARKADAEDTAVERCRQTAGADRAAFCVVSLSECDRP
jgi:hypothetical protein